MKPWFEQARAAWAEATIEDLEGDSGLHLARVTVKTAAPKPADIAAHIQSLLALEGTNRPCALSISAENTQANDAGKHDAFFVTHVAIDPGVAWGTLKPLDVAKRLVERNVDNDSAFRCSTPTWFLASTMGHFERDWRAYVREYSNVWDGSEKNALEAEKICERAADLELLKGETFPDSSNAIESGVKFPKMSSQTIKWRSFAEYKDSKDWFDCTVNANEAPTIKWDHPRE